MLGIIKLINAVAGLCFWGLLLTVGTLQFDWQPTAQDGLSRAKVGMGVVIPAEFVQTTSQVASMAGTVTQQEALLTGAKAIATSVSAQVDLREWVQTGWAMAEAALTEATDSSSLIAVHHDASPVLINDSASTGLQK